jgi:transcription initiation factor TFIIIB Brf1 subunit/transcription initiation factor TFIIB
VSLDRQTSIPHSCFGAKDCCGCLNTVIRGDQAEIVCNECGVVIQTVSAAELDRAITKLELALNVATAMCPYCGSVNLFPGFSEIKAFVCRECGEGVTFE